MITKVRIQNFKSVEDLTIELGQVNVIIGANGTGKSNILEGIAMGAAALENPLILDHRSITQKIRSSEPSGMISGFATNPNDSINLGFESNENALSWSIKIKARKTDPRHWFVEIKDVSINEESNYRNIDSPGFSGFWTNILKLADGFSAFGDNILKLQTVSTDLSEEEGIEFEDFGERIHSCSQLQGISLARFLIYAPENTFLRKFEETGQITPLGLRGEGLFYELKQIFTLQGKRSQLEEIKEHLELFDWFEDIELPNGLLSMEYRLSIKDRYRAEGLEALDQRSANEGFLYWLFYLVLFTSKHTPQFFAIENIETAFNPRMCREVIKRLAELAKKHDKQVIFTTHNPAILDGIDLKDDQQRLFVARRGKKGQTLIDRIEHKPQVNMKLSEIWMKGYIGGIPNNF